MTKKEIVSPLKLNQNATLQDVAEALSNNNKYTKQLQSEFAGSYNTIVDKLSIEDAVSVDENTSLKNMVNAFVDLGTKASGGKRIVQGETMSLGMTAFYYADGSGNFESMQNYSIPLEELGFRPTTLISTCSVGSYQYTTIIYSIGTYVTDYDSNNSFTLTMVTNSTTNSTTVYHFKTRYWLTGNVISGNEVFVPIAYNSGSSAIGNTFRWVAYE